MTHNETVPERLLAALTQESASARLQTAMAAGLRPDDSFIDVLVGRFGVEPDFFVRDMLTWALLHHDRERTLARVLPELGSAVAQARSQALHTLSKLGDPRGWSAITDEHLFDADDGVARTAWRAAATLAPPAEASVLASKLATLFGRGDHETQRSLSRALLMLGDAATQVIAHAALEGGARVRAHAIATQRLVSNPNEGFDVAIAAARRLLAVQGAPLIGDLDG